MTTENRKPKTENRISVVGGGLAGGEAAWQAARRGVPVRLYEMKPRKFSPAHSSPLLGELVCSNSLRADSVDSAVGLLKEEMRRLGSLVIAASNPKDVQAETRQALLGKSVLISYYPNTKLDRADVSLQMGSLGTLKIRTIRMSPGYGPDEILFHEMVHAARFLGGDDGPAREEEFFAVLVASIYISPHRELPCLGLTS